MEENLSVWSMSEEEEKEEDTPERITANPPPCQTDHAHPLPQQQQPNQEPPQQHQHAMIDKNSFRHDDEQQSDGHTKNNGAAEDSSMDVCREGTKGGVVRSSPLATESASLATAEEGALLPPQPEPQLTTGALLQSSLLADAAPTAAAVTRNDSATTIATTPTPATTPALPSASSQQQQQHVSYLNHNLILSTTLTTNNNSTDTILVGQHRGGKPPENHGTENTQQQQHRVSDPPQQPQQRPVEDPMMIDDNRTMISPETCRLRRRCLKRIGKRAKHNGDDSSKSGGNPSFVAMLQVKYEEVSDDEGDLEKEEKAKADRKFKKENDNNNHSVVVSLEQLPRCIRIDVDAELGLKDAKPTLVFKRETDGTLSQYHSQHQRQDRFGGDCDDRERVATGNRGSRSVLTTPADEGWYEGSKTCWLPEDHEYLSKAHQWVRQNTEYFSATLPDMRGGGLTAKQSPLRRTSSSSSMPVVWGQVGIRCRHCAAATNTSSSASSNVVQPGETKSASTTTTTTPPGSVVYPASLSTLSSLACTQKMQSHLEDCPNLSYAGKMQLMSVVQESEDAGYQRAPRQGGLSLALYYIISARRLGLVDVMDGIRFGRDLKLDPLPFATIRAQVENENAGLMTEPGAEGVDPMAPVAFLEPRITADAESEAVLAEAVAESSDDSTGSGEHIALCRLKDKALITDFLFLAMRQLSVCHIVLQDFVSRGKKTKMIRLGLAGYCCRWCQGDSEGRHGDDGWSCRSFPSAAEGLSSSISNSFATHLQKCRKVPDPVKKALLAYKKLHHRQMGQLTYGSQSRLFREIWSRLRAADKNEETSSSELLRNPSDTANMDHIDSSDHRSLVKPFADNDVFASVGEEATDRQAFDEQRDSGVPVCHDEETVAVLQKAETNWDLSVNGHLIVPQDRHLVSDYVFLAMRQLTKVSSDDLDVQRRRQTCETGMPGLACIHCFHEDQSAVSPVGRSFPSAPDNFASALNTSLFNHMQACLHIPDSIKRALVNTRKIHSAQCASIKFGSQRRYFNLLYDRLINANDLHGSDSIPPSSRNHVDSFLTQCGFMDLPNKDKSKVMAICLSCRMVPIQFRVRDSCFVGKPRYDLVRQHQTSCKGSYLDLEAVTDLLEEALQESCNGTKDSFDINAIASQSFKSLVGTAVGDEQSLIKLFTEDIHKGLLRRQARGIEAGCLDFESDLVSRGTQGIVADLWNAFPSFVDVTLIQATFRTFAEEIGISPNVNNHRKWMEFLSLISPSLVFPREHVKETQVE